MALGQGCPTTESSDRIASVTRRTFLAATSIAAAQPSSVPIIDAHIHLFDPTRPEGIPWPPKNDAVLYKPALPGRLRQVASPLGIVGAIHVECSPLIQDNQWVLDTASKDPIIVGVVGHLVPGKPEFRKHLDRFRQNKLFLGIRFGNLWGYDLSGQISNPDFIAGLKTLAEAGLELDTANPNPALLAAVVRLSDKAPDLRIVIDHLPQLQPPSDAAARREYEAMLRELAKRKQIYVKISEVLRNVDGRVPEDLEFYRPRLDQLWELFGEDRLIYGSDWPNSDRWKPYPTVLRVVREYFTAKGPAAAEKYFWKNSAAVYRWVKRDASQPS